MRIKILVCSGLLSVLAFGGGAFAPSITASGGTTTTTVIWPGTLGGSSSQAYGTSSNGAVIVGYASNVAGQYRATLDDIAKIEAAEPKVAIQDDLKARRNARRKVQRVG